MGEWFVCVCVLIVRTKGTSMMGHFLQQGLTVDTWSILLTRSLNISDGSCMQQLLDVFQMQKPNSQQCTCSLFFFPLLQTFWGHQHKDTHTQCKQMSLLAKTLIMLRLNFLKPFEFSEESTNHRRLEDHSQQVTEHCWPFSLIIDIPCPARRLYLP